MCSEVEIQVLNHQLEEFNVTVNTVTAAAFSSGGNMNNRRAMSGGAGTSAGLVAGGYISDFSSRAEEYDGSSWTNGGTA